MAAETRYRAKRVAERLERAGEAGGTADTDLRVELGGFDTDGRRRRGEAALGRAHVAAPSDQGDTVADRQRLPQGRRFGAILQLARIIGDRPPHQPPKRIQSGFALRPEPPEPRPP